MLKLTHRRTPECCVVWRCSGTDVSEEQMCNVFPAVSVVQAADGPPWSERNMLSDYYTLAETTRLNAVCHSNTRRLHSSLQPGFWHAGRYLYLFEYCVAHIPTLLIKHPVCILPQCALHFQRSPFLFCHKILLCILFCFTVVHNVLTALKCCKVISICVCEAVSMLEWWMSVCHFRVCVIN